MCYTDFDYKKFIHTRFFRPDTDFKRYRNMEKANAKLNVGFLVSGIMDGFTQSVAQGVIHAAKKADINLVMIPCKYLDRDLSQNPEIMYEYQYNTMISYARRDNLDAVLVMADCIGCHTTRSRVLEMLSEYRDMPCVLIASRIEGYVGVSYDNFNGIKEGLTYLLRELHCTKFAMVGGPDDNSDAFERKQAFISVLEQNGITLSERNFSTGNLSRWSEEAFRQILDNNPDAEAIFCVNDETALGLYDEMKKRGLIPGKDIYVFGYDNTLPASKAKPSLSSIWADSAKMGVEAVNLLLEMCQGKEVSSKVLPATFVKRDSFGAEIPAQADDGARQLTRNDIEAAFDAIFYRCKNELSGEQMEKIHTPFSAMLEKILLLNDRKETDPALCDEILGHMDDFFSSGALQFGDIDMTMMLLQRLYNMVTANPAHAEYVRSNNLVTAVYRKVTNAMDTHFLAMQEDEQADSYNIKLFVQDTMQFRTGKDQSYRTLLKRLSWLNIQNAYVYVFERAIIHLDKEHFTLPRYIFLKAMLKDGKAVSLPADAQRKRIQELFCNEEIGSELYSMVLLPLFSNETIFGVLLCDMTDQLFENGEFLSNQLSSAVKMIQLLNENEKIQEQLEQSLITLRENNIELDNLSKSDMLTGILNRRGFYAAAEDFLEDTRKQRKSTLTIYVDMDNLKIINDRYGHEEGDYSLRLIGQILKETVNGCGIAGRIGGDEFACVMEQDGEDDGQIIQEEIQSKFRFHNANSDKPYNVTVSIGIYVRKPVEQTSLGDALSLADEKLYLAKRNRLKIVDKAAM